MFLRHHKVSPETEDVEAKRRTASCATSPQGICRLLGLAKQGAEIIRKASEHETKGSEGEVTGI